MNVDSKSDETAMVCNFLARFQGFNANGYFDVNHSLLTGMTANFVTYLVIMIQFDQSEMQDWIWKVQTVNMYNFEAKKYFTTLVVLFYPVISNFTF